MSGGLPQLPALRQARRVGKQSRMRKERRDEKSGHPSGAPERSVGYWAVAFLDLMGYGVALKAFDVYPIPTDKVGQDALSAKVMRPWHLLNRLKDGVDLFKNASLDVQASDLSRLPPEARQLAATWRAARINTYILGDAVVMEMPLAGDARHFPARAIDTMLSAACSTSINQLAAGADDLANTLPLRGGIDVGVGAILKGKLHSAALAKAVDLEDTANFPRIQAGEALRGYVESMAEHEGTDLTSSYIRGLMRGARGFLFEDPTDGKWCLDFLGEWVCHRMPVARDLIRPAHAFVQKALSRHKDEDLLRKYRWLDDYIKSRLPVWGLT